MFNFTPIFGKFIERRKRFFLDVKLDSGEAVVAHCHNPGRISDMLAPNSLCCLSEINGPSLKFKWQMSYIQNTWVGINTMVPNQLVFEGLKNKFFPDLKEFTVIKPEYHIPDSRHRLDFKITDPILNKQCIIEVKNVHWRPDDLLDEAKFPDCPTSRSCGQVDLMGNLKKQNIYQRAIVIFVVQRSDCNVIGVDNKIDPKFALALKKSMENGVEVIGVNCTVEPGKICLNKLIDFDHKSLVF